MLILRLLKRSLSQQHRQHGTRDRRVVSRHASSLKTTPSAGDRAREEKKENERWAKQPGAREVLAQPPFNEDREQGAEADMCRSLEDYLKARRWHHPDGPGRRFLSHLLTYPLTLAAALHKVGLSSAPPVHGVSTPSVDHPAGITGVGVAGTSVAGTPATANTMKARVSGEKVAGMSAAERTATTAEAAGGDHRLSVVCVGARAESTLPPDFWREALFALPGVSRLSLHLLGPELGLPPGVSSSRRGEGEGRRGGGAPPPFPVGMGGRGGGDAPLSPLPDHPTAIVSIGDRTVEIGWICAVLDKSTGECVEVRNLKEQEVPVTGAGAAGVVATVSAAAAAASAAAITAAPADAGGGAEAGGAVGAAAMGTPAAESTLTGAAAAVAAAESAIAGADAFVLFNPGLGHPHLREGWEGAVKRLLTSGKPVIVSCHSRQDLDRDEQQLRAIDEGWNSGGAGDGEGVDFLYSRENAFSSRMMSEDPVPSVAGAEEIVSNNWGLLIVRGKK